ncbi:hypothetical protein EUTSA_v10024144mg, partial [Eutrema salsugineum]
SFLAGRTTTRHVIVLKISEWQVQVTNGLTTENMFHSTFFWCYMSKDGGHMDVQVFWDDVILFYRCGWKNCVWTAKTDGVYLWNSVIGEDVLSEKWEVGC